MTQKSYDSALGVVLRRRRAQGGLSQTEVGNRVGITFQQLQKYEKGTNRVFFSRLVQLADALNTTPEQLIADVRDVIEPEAATADAPGSKVDPSDTPQTLELVRLAHAVPGHTLRPVMNLLRSLAKAAPNERPS
jgi:transcriptional regulator with XRE-family HTH domain